MVEQIEKMGGVVGMSHTILDEEAERFLKEVLACPDCCGDDHEDSLEWMPLEGPGIDEILAGPPPPRRQRGH